MLGGRGLRMEDVGVQSLGCGFRVYHILGRSQDVHTGMYREP